MGGIQLYQDDVSRLQEKKLLNDQVKFGVIFILI